MADAGTVLTDDGGGTIPAVTDHGIMVDFSSRKPVAGLTVSEGDQNAVTGADGKFQLAAPKGKPVTLTVTAPNYPKTFFPEEVIDADYDRAEVPIADLSLFHLAQLALDGYDSTRGIVYVAVDVSGACTSIEGGTIAINSPPDAKLMYFASKFPSASQTSFKQGEIPAAVVYNVPAGSQIDITITHPTCAMVPFPATFEGRQYTGHITVEAGDSNTAVNYFLQ